MSIFTILVSKRQKYIRRTKIKKNRYDSRNRQERNLRKLNPLQVKSLGI